jgi:XTP/dITP diphosphohydrolase
VPSSSLVVASANPGKLREFRALLSGLPFSVTSLAELKIESPQETGRSFAENALLKARHAARAAAALAADGQVAALADDSGLEVDALHGAPGIYSARFAGPQADDAANNAKLLAALAGVPAAARGARYRCALAFVGDADDPAPLVAEGVWEGVILDAPRGGGGFGYDPYFWIPALQATAAELEPGRKNSLSHRGTALRALRVRLEGRQPAADPRRGSPA